MENIYRNTNTAKTPFEEANSTLDPLKAALIKIVNEGHDSFYRNNSNSNMAVYEKRTKANAIRDYVVDAAKELFQSDPNVQIRTIRGLFLICVGKYAIRVKKVDKNLRAGNIKTKQNKAFTKQLTLPGFPEETIFLDLGYVYDMAGDISRVHLICREGEYISWDIELLSGRFVTSLSLFPATEQEQTENTQRFTIKKEDNKKKLG